jgi:hypothetical protein
MCSPALFSASKSQLFKPDPIFGPAQTVRPESRRERAEQTVNRVVRQMRQLRVERLAPVQRLAQEWTQSVRLWLRERLGVEESRRVTARQSVTQQETQRQSRGIRM